MFLYLRDLNANTDDFLFYFHFMLASLLLFSFAVSWYFFAQTREGVEVSKHQVE